MDLTQLCQLMKSSPNYSLTQSDHTQMMEYRVNGFLESQKYSGVNSVN